MEMRGMEGREKGSTPQTHTPPPHHHHTTKMAKAMKKSGGAKKSAATGEKKRKPKRSYATYIGRVLRSTTKSKATLSSKSVRILNSLVVDFFDRIATEAASLARSNKKQTLGSREVQTAVRLLLPTELAKHSISEATRALAKASA